MVRIERGNEQYWGTPMAIHRNWDRADVSLCVTSGWSRAIYTKVSLHVVIREADSDVIVLTSLPSGQHPHCRPHSHRTFSPQPRDSSAVGTIR